MLKATLLSAFALAAWAQLAPPAREIPLYPGVAPGSENWHYSERTAGTAERPQAQNIIRPVLLYYPADKTNRTICDAAACNFAIMPGRGWRLYRQRSPAAVGSIAAAVLGDVDERGRHKRVHLSAFTALP